MTENAKSREWPLVIFTLALQMSGGLVLAATLCDAEAGLRADGLIRPIAVAALPIAVLGMFASVLHLGRPWLAWRSLLNLRQSRLSVEVLLTGIYAASCAAYSWAWFGGSAQIRFELGILTSVVGIATVVASAVVYMVPNQPAWNSKWVLGSFVGTMLTAGGTTCTALLYTRPQGRMFMSPLIMTLIGAALIIASVGALARQSRRSGWRLTTQQRFQVAVHVALAGVVPIILIAQASASGATLRIAQPTVVFAMLAGTLIGVLLGRTLLYSLMRESF